MATAINSYTNKTAPVGADKVLGTDSVDNGTHNFRLLDIQTFVNSGDVTIPDDKIFSGNIAAQGQTLFVGNATSNNTGFDTVFFTSSNGRMGAIQSTTGGVGISGFQPGDNTGIGTTQFRHNNTYSDVPIRIGADDAKNEFDDYEEDVWTPTFDGAGSNPDLTITLTSATYTKTGNKVHIWCTVIASAFSGASTSVSVGGLPYTLDTASTRGVLGGFGYGTANTLYNEGTGIVESGSSTASIGLQNSDGSNTLTGQLGGFAISLYATYTTTA